MRNNITAQIFTGGFDRAVVTFDQIKSKLDQLGERLQISKVIMGWAFDETLYAETKRYLAERNIELYLWLPVFAEIGLLRDMEPTVSYDGSPIDDIRLLGGESFNFYCPTHERNMDNFISIYEQHFSRFPVDGVFLDRIRYGSFANGTQAVLSCFCDSCRREFDRLGVSLGDVRDLMMGSKDKAPFLPSGYLNGKYTFDRPLITAFFEAKSQIIGARIAKLHTYFKQAGHKVGLDVFAPFCSYFVGQDIPMLSKTADFIKPMMYRVTHAPAGLPYEFEKVVDGISQWGTGADRDHVRSKLLEMYGVATYDPACFDARFVMDEIKWMSEAADCDIYSGIEINFKQGICEATPEYIRETLRDLEQIEADGVVLSWDVVSAPDANVKAL